MSAERFNPPPSWPIPRGWSPPPDWEPDPSWPPAPPGWRFWIEDQPEADEQPWAPYRGDPTEQASVPYPGDPIEQSFVPYPQDEGEQPWAPYPGDASEQARPKNRRRIGLLAAAAALTVALTAGTVAVVTWWKDSPEQSTRPENMLPGTYPSAPQDAWTAEADAQAPGTDSSFATPLFGAAYYRSPGAIVTGQHVVVHITPDEPTTEGAQLVSLSLADGHVEWSTPVNMNDGCARDLLGDTLPCIESTTSGGAHSVQFVDIDDGSVTSTVQLPFYVNMLASDGENLYTGGFDQSDGFVVTKGTRDDPTSAWRVTIPEGECEGAGGGDASDLRVKDGIVWGFMSGGAWAALHDSDGSPIFDHDVENVSVVAGPTITARHCDRSLDTEQWSTDVANEKSLLFSTDSHVLNPSLEVYAGGPPPFVTDAAEGLDPTTGNTLWHLPDWPTTDSVTTAVVGNVLLAQGYPSDVITAYATDTGQGLWGASPAAFGEQAVTDGRNIISTLNGQLQARSLTNGDKQWSMPLPMQTSNELVDIYATDAGLLYVTKRQIGLMRPTGPAAPVPAISGTTDEDQKDGGTNLVTKCGRPPEFKPEAVRAESGELVITVKIVAKCPGGDVVDGQQTRIAVTSGGQNVASAIFDLSTRPIIIEPGSGGSSDNPSVTHEFHFPVGTFWRIPVSVDEAPGNGTTQRGRVDLDSSTLLVECEQDGSSGNSSQAGNSNATASNSSTATGAGRPKTGDDESASFDALRAIANADRPFVMSHLADRWVPQLSSKRPGLVADGITWNNAETLREHLDLRLKYPEVRLLWSGDWSTFSAPDFWITIAGVTFPDAGGALAWCTSHGLDREHCYAKLVSTTHPIDGSTAFNK